MTSSFPVATPLRGFFSRTFALSAFGLALCTHDLCAQVGDNNPSGVSGIFNGQVDTGCSYDPYTGNATRSITDIAVAGAIGDYPLALVRTSNSRAPSTTEVFGWAGGWTTIIIGFWRIRLPATLLISSQNATRWCSPMVEWRLFVPSLGIVFTA